MNNTKQKIIDAMYDLIAEKGYDKSSIAQICEVVGIKKPSVYYYFKSKEDIFVELYKQTLDADEHLLKKSIFLVDNESYMKFLYSGLIDYLYSYDDKYWRIIMEFHIQSTRIDRIKELDKLYYSKFYKLLHEIINKGIKFRALKIDINIDLNIQILLNTIYGLENSIVYDIPFDFKAIWDETINRLLFVEGTK